MANEISGLFGKYESTYTTVQSGGAREEMNAKGQRKTSRYELRGFDADGLRISKRGGNFLDRVVCWFEERVFSLTRSGTRSSLRQKSSNQFASDVAGALREIDPDLVAEGRDIKDHDLMKQIESVRVRDLPLRSGFVRGILQEVATLARGAGHGGDLSELAIKAFPVQDEEPEQPAAALEVAADAPDNREDGGVTHPNLSLPDALKGGQYRQEGDGYRTVNPGDQKVEVDGQVRHNRDKGMPGRAQSPQDAPWGGGVSLEDSHSDGSLEDGCSMGFDGDFLVGNSRAMPTGPVDGQFSFKDLSEEALLKVLRTPVMSKIVIPELNAQNFFEKEERSAESEAAAGEIGRFVTTLIVGGFGPVYVQEVLDKHLDEVRQLNQQQDKQPNGKAEQAKALNKVVDSLLTIDEFMIDARQTVLEGASRYHQKGITVEQQGEEGGMPGAHQFFATQQVMQNWPFPSNPFAEEFSFTDLGDNEFLAQLGEHVKSEIVVPELQSQNFWKDGHGVNENKAKIVDGISGAVAGEIAVVSQSVEQIKQTANEALGVLKLSVKTDDTDPPSDEQLQAKALKSVVQRYQAADTEGRLKGVVVRELGHHLAPPDGVRGKKEVGVVDEDLLPDAGSR